MEEIRSQFPILQEEINGQSLVYFDNGATTQKPKAVVEAVSDFYLTSNSNVHRSMNCLAESATEKYEAAREKIRKFINAASVQEIVFTRNATESLNLVARTWGEINLQEGDVIVLSIAEHHSNIVPWLQLAEKKKIKLEFIDLKDGQLNLPLANKLLDNPQVKLLTIQTISNTLGIKHDLTNLLAKAKDRGIKVLLDASQSSGHEPLDVQKLDCDWLAFSSHKTFGPTGLGVLYGRKEILAAMPAFLGGGDMIDEVFTDKFTTNELPYKFEAGTPHIAGVVGLGAAVDFIQQLGWEKIQAQEKKLTEYLLTAMGKLDFVEIYGHREINHHIPTVAFNINGIHGHDVGDLLGQAGIAVRAGQHCTQPLHDYLEIPGTVRASLSFYNTTAEIDKLIAVLKEINNKFH